MLPLLSFATPLIAAVVVFSTLFGLYSSTFRTVPRFPVPQTARTASHPGHERHKTPCRKRYPIPETGCLRRRQWPELSHRKFLDEALAPSVPCILRRRRELRRSFPN